MRAEAWHFPLFHACFRLPTGQIRLGAGGRRSSVTEKGREVVTQP